jgi:hypothetical protein
MKKIITILRPALFSMVAGLLFSSCGAMKEVPVQTVEKIVYRDSLIYVNDTIKVEIPRETVREVVPELDTSYLKTSVAESVAYLDTAKRKLHHTLTQKGEIKVVYDTIVKIQYVDRILEKEVPVEVEVIKYKRDSLFWVLVAWAALCIVYAVLKLTLYK